MTGSVLIELPRDARRAARAGEGAAVGATEEDNELLARIARGEERALEQLVQRHGGWAARFAERLTGSAALAEEAVQSAFLKVWQGAERWEGRARFTTWFYRVLHNLCIDQLRRARGRFEALDEEIPDLSPTPSEDFERERRDRAVRAALASLPERQRAAIVLSHFEECSQLEAARILGISEGALESLLSRARAKLRTLLEAAAREEETG